jgi:acetyl esterase/lipase
LTQPVLFYPVTNANFDTPSYREFATHHFLSREAMKWFWNHYLPEENLRKHKTSSCPTSVLAVTDCGRRSTARK